MAPTFARFYVEPGTYVLIEDVSLPAAPSNILYPALIGLGAKTLTKISQTVRGATSTDTIVTDVSSVQVIKVIGNITDENGIVYIPYDPDTTIGDFTFHYDTPNGIEWITAGPAEGVTYQLTYVREKIDAEYIPKLLTKIGDVETWYGPAQGATVLASGTGDITVTTGDNPDTLTGTDFDDIPVGSYVTFGGVNNDGKVRVVVDVSPTTLVLVAHDSTTSYSNAHLTAEVGASFTVTDISVNEISLGADLSFSNGAPLIMGSQMMDNTTTSINSTSYPTGALTKLRDYEPYIVVLMRGVDSTDASLIASVKAHVTQMSEILEKKERIALLAGKTSMIADASTYISEVTTILTGLNSNLISYLLPSVAKRTIIMASTLAEQQMTFDGSYLAAALSGVITGRPDEGEPITWKPISGFDDISYPIITGDLLRNEKNQLAGKGALILEKKGTAIIVRHAVTTSITTPVSQELKVTVIAHTLAKDIRTLLDQTVIGTRDRGPATDANIRAIVSFYLDRKVALPSIQSYKNLAVSTNQFEPRQIDITFQIKPPFDLECGES